MTEAQGMSQSQDTSSPPVVSSQSAPVSQNTAPQEEKSFRQSEVNALVGREKARAVEDYKRLQTEQPNYVQQKSNEAVEHHRSQQPQVSNSEQEMRRFAAEEAQRHFDGIRDQARIENENKQAHLTVQKFFSKIATGKEKYQDFEKVVPDNETLSFYPNTVSLLAEHIDNSDDVLYYLGKDLTKMELIENMSNRNYRVAIKQIQNLSQSLKDNEAASKMKVPNAPLSQMRPSNTGTDNGVMSVGDFRKKYRG
jgi:hypothetical protein